MGTNQIVASKDFIRRKASGRRGATGFFFFWLLPALAVGQHAADQPAIVVHGARALPEPELVETIRKNLGNQLASIATDKIGEVVAQHYFNAGYLDARVDSVHREPGTSGVNFHITLFLTEGSLTRTGAVHLIGSHLLQLDNASALEIWKEGEPFSVPALEEGIQRVLSVYERNGYPFAKAVVETIQFRVDGGQNWADATIRVEPGAPASISDIAVQGNKTTQTFVIVREARVTAGERFTSTLAERVRQRLNRMNLFSAVEIPALSLEASGRATLLVKVTEGTYNSFDGILGYVPPQTSGNDGYFSGMVNLQFRNLLGTARKLSTRWYRENKSSQEIELHY
ncbi:MAG: hypothetical protein HY966_05215, partial [Ignavibacteriales bacterium]|nr:hypothetical protein [Ignavibacteriales bacterium]